MIEMRRGIAAAPDSVDRAVNWRDRAACVGQDPELFFPYSSDEPQAEAAKRVCRTCPALRDCLGYALVNDVAGVWGGTSERERAAMRAKHRIAAHPVFLQLPGDDVQDDVARLQGGGARRRT